MLSEYEKQRLENIKKNNEVLKSLGLDATPVPVADQPLKPPKRKRPAPVKKEAKEILPIRKSLRTRYGPIYRFIVGFEGSKLGVATFGHGTLSASIDISAILGVSLAGL